METSTTGNLANASALYDDASSADVVLHVISPPSVPGDAVYEQHDDLSRSLFGNDTAAIRDNIPSQHLCPIVQEPPFDAVHFDLPSTNGTTTAPNSQQVYKKLALYRLVGTQGAMSSQRTLSCPFTRVGIAQNLAWDYVRPVAPTLQETLLRERLAFGLLLEDDNPLKDKDCCKYNQTTRGCVDC